MEAVTGCLCGTLPDLAAVPMGGDGLDERVLATIDTICDHGGAEWWLDLRRCSACGQHWMIAQEERIYDEYFLKRLTAEEAEVIRAAGRWPDDFLTYERVLRVGCAHGNPFTFLDSRSPSLVDTIADLRRARPEIDDSEIAMLIGISERRVAKLGKIPSPRRWWRRLLPQRD